MADKIAQTKEENQEKGSYIFREHNLTDNFTTFSNILLREPTLSLGALGLLVYLLSFPRNWKVYVDFIAKNRKEGKDAIYARLKELGKAGYLKRFQHRNKDGTFDPYTYQVFSTKQTPVSPLRDYPRPDKPRPVNPQLQSINSTKEVKVQRKKKEVEEKVAKAPTTIKFLLVSSRSNVKLTEKEITSLKAKLKGDYDKGIERFSEWLEESGQIRKSHYRSILNWIPEALHNEKQQEFNKTKTKEDKAQVKEENRQLLDKFANILCSNTNDPLVADGIKLEEHYFYDRSKALVIKYSLSRDEIFDLIRQKYDVQRPYIAEFLNKKE